ncbi:SusC/RagA family TonB-linked outer membrane protein [Adhaeribacter aquaticus]|uniref:SusC/RagA family TonB-linked outer membrane protein n=1 Tax=Adhaeribacter aquaticus TaxID=299567 RepID=UPI00040E988B|nr:TonB-dependent receptor [Adhaeribacter aquaticus]
MKKYLQLIILILIAVQSTVYGQVKSVTGRVTGSNNEGLPGVSIQIKGTNSGTVSDVDGKFSIQAKNTDILAISYIGYLSQEITVGTRTNFNVSLKEDQKVLSEVVVTGYGEIKRANVSSAQTTIKAEEMQKTVNTTIEQAIQGRAAGVYVTQNTGQPGGGISVNIRGINSINGTNEPLYVIDGVQMQPGNVGFGATSSSNPLAGLNPADIESMEILQGPSATAIYGSRGTNGVVVISTKRGKSGEMKVNYGYLYTLQDKPKTLPVMSLREYATMTNEMRALTGATPNADFQDPSILGEGTNWQNALFKRAPLQKHQLSLSGGNEKSQVYLSGEYFNQEGVAIGSKFDRYSFRINVDNQARKWLKLSTNLAVNQTKDRLSSTQENVIITALQMAPNIAVVNPNGSWGGADESNGAAVQFAPLNPIALANIVQNNLTRRGVIGGLNAEVNIMKGLVARTSLSGNVNFSNSHYFTPSYTIGGRTNPTADLQQGSSNNTYWNWNQLLQYNRKVGKHDIDVMASHESQASNYYNISGRRQGFLSNDLPVLSLGNAIGQTNNSGQGAWAMESYLGRAIYSFNEKYILQGAIRADGSANFGPENKWGYFPSVSAAWRVSQEPFMKNIPVINDFKIRYETGLTGNQGTGGIYAPMRAIPTTWGSGFVVNQYGNPNLQWESTLTNNIGFNISLLQNRIQLEGDLYIKKTDNLLMQAPLPDYMGATGNGSIGKPTVNIGALQNKGYAFSINTVNMDRDGFKWNTNFNVSGFRAKVTKFFTETAMVERSAWFMSYFTQRSVVGQTPWLFYGYTEDGIFKSIEEIQNSPVPTRNGVRLPIDQANGVWVGDTKYKDINGDGVIDERDQSFIGNPWPKATFGMTNSLAYKGFDFTLLLTGSYGNDVFNYVRFANSQPNNINLGRNLMKSTFDYARVGGDANNPQLLNPGTDVPRISSTNVNGNGQRITSKFVEDGSYLRVKNIQLGYNLPNTLLARQKAVQGVRLAVGVQNIYTFTKYSGYDPEVGAYVGRDAQVNSQTIGADYGRYPLTPMYTFSLGVDF